MFLFAFLMVALLAAPPPTPDPRYPLPSNPIWRLDTGSDFDWWKQTPPGWLLIGTAGELKAVEPDSGTIVWTRTDLEGMNRFSLRMFPPTDLVLVNIKETDTAPRKRALMFRVTTGEDLWSTDTLGLSQVDDARLIPGRAALMLIGRGPDNERVAIAVGLTSGVILWRTQALFRKWKGEIALGDVDRVVGTWGFYQDTDSTLIACMNTRTVRKVNVFHDELVWESKQKLDYAGPAYFTEPDPDRDEQSLPEVRTPEFSVSGDGAVLFVAHHNTVSAIRVADGTKFWPKSPRLGGVAIDWFETPERLIVLAYESRPKPSKHIVAIDRESGAVDWFAPHAKFLGKTVHRTWSECSNLMPVDDGVIVAAAGEIKRFNLRNAHVEKLGDLGFETSDPAQFIEERSDGYMVAGVNRASWYDGDWQRVDDVHFEAPDNFSLGLALLGLGLTAGIVGDFRSSESGRISRPLFKEALLEMNTEFHATQDTRRCLFILADPAEGTGGIPEALSGPFVMVVDKETRATLASLPAGKVPDYKVDPGGRRVFFKRNSQRIDCYRF